MISLPNVTVVIVDTVNYSLAFAAIEKTLKQIKPARTIFFTDITWPQTDQLEVVNIKHLFSKKDYSQWMIKELGKQDIQTSHVLVIQWDGFVLDGEMWDDTFLGYDYLGALWPESDGYANGNGGFSLRSMKLCKALAEDDFIYPISPEDVGICRIYRSYLEQEHGIVFGPDKVCQQFSYELIEPFAPTFGFHGKFHPPYRETVVIKRTAAMGDVVQVEPVLHHFYIQGYRVVLDTLPQFYALFAFHGFPVEDYNKFNKNIRHRVVNLDLAYEFMPKQLHLKAYFAASGISNYTLRNPKMYFNGQNKLFPQKYVVIHIDERPTTHRNIYGIDWIKVRHHLENMGYLVVQIGKAQADDAGIRFNTVNEALMMWLIAGCDLFIGVDSGPANLAVALDRRSIIFFGSVNPEYIHYDMSKIVPIQSACPIDNQHCWHSVQGTEGVPCAVDDDMPPCCLVSTHKLIQGIKKAITL